MVSRRFCVQCGHALKPETRFCTTCGLLIQESDGGEAARADPSGVDTIAPQAGPAPPRPPGPQPRVSSRRFSRWPVVIAIVVLIGAVAGSAAGLLTRRAGHGGAAATPRPTATPAVTSAAPSLSPGPAEQRAAQGLSALLAQSVAARGSVDRASRDLARCGPLVGQDAATFRQAAASRQRLLSRLGALPGQSTLPVPMIQALTRAWQASVQADQDFAAWAQDENSHGCAKNSTSDPNFQAATGPDNRATRYKKVFAASWNPIAVRYGLPAYQWNQL